jgi:hypothetical protein
MEDKLFIQFQLLYPQQRMQEEVKVKVEEARILYYLFVGKLYQELQL